VINHIVNGARKIFCYFIYNDATEVFRMKNAIPPADFPRPRFSHDHEFEGAGARVMHVVDALKLGGSEHVAIGLAVQHARLGLRPMLVAVRAPKCSAEPMREHYCKVLKENGILFHELGSSNSRSSLIKPAFQLAKLIGQYSPDLVHSHTDIPDFVVSGARRIRPFRIARTIHSTSLWATHPTIGFIVEQGLQNDLVIGVSQDALTSYRQLRQRYRLRASPHQRVISNGVRVGLPDQLQFEKKRYCCPPPLRIAFFGRLDYYKGLDVLVAALMGWRSEKPLPIELSIFSDAAFDHGFRNQISSLPCKLHLCPPVPNASEIMSRFDVIVVPSRVEGLSLVALESLAAKTPVIGTRILGLREALPPDWPLLVPPGDPEALLKILLEIVNGQFDLGILGDIGYKHVQSFSASECAETYLETYLKYLPRMP
jgi:glycosyltransferase involved in cell wall biosynthesis